MVPRPSCLAIVLAAALGAGCHSAAKNGALPTCAVPPCQPGEQSLRVQLPPQKITIEQPESDTTTVPPIRLENPPSEAARDQRRPEAARPEADRVGGRPEAAEAEAGLGTLAGLGQVASFSRTTAVTRPLGVNSGNFSLGIGIQWIHIPFPWIRLFSVEETPSITVPLNEANLVPAGCYPPGVVRGGEAVLTREAIAAAVAQELAAARAQSRRSEAPAADDEERKRLEKKLAEAEAQVERMAKILKGLEEKLPPPRP